MTKQATIYTLSTTFLLFSFFAFPPLPYSGPINFIFFSVLLSCLLSFYALNHVRSNFLPSSPPSYQWLFHSYAVLIRHIFTFWDFATVQHDNWVAIHLTFSSRFNSNLVLPAPGNGLSVFVIPLGTKDIFFCTNVHVQLMYLNSVLDPYFINSSKPVGRTVFLQSLTVIPPPVRCSHWKNLTTVFLFSTRHHWNIVEQFSSTIRTWYRNNEVLCKVIFVRSKKNSMNPA